MPRKKRSASPFELMDDDFDDNSSQSSRNGNPPIQRNAANARERARMRVLSSAFGRLKTKLPNIPADTKLSKLDTLRLATMYIKQLKTVVEGGSASPATNGESLEGSLNINGNNATNCYLNLNTGVQSMNWPFGFHHHLSNSPLIRSTSSTSLINNTNNNNSSNNNWSQTDSHNEEQLKPLRYDSENYERHSHQPQTSLYMHHTTLTQQNNNHQHNQHWYSETPSPELDSTSSTCLTFENTHLQHQPEHHHQQQQQQLHNNQHHHHHDNLSHLQTASTHSSTFQLQHDFHDHHHHHQHQQHQPSQTHHLHQNAFVNTSNFQSTSIR
ncbi:probable serine/threonine-protein kinase DDB_G0280133 [Calliphora vicina]|uniref:probable serine/threonine-protein kinase DDB_G0280133 n=1 Tax=Calliphora vicina TaxID=7373 RepID=UPI00325B4A0B